MTMRILDQLRKEVLEKQQKEITQLAAEQSLEANYQQLILPKMQMILIYMQELIEHLNFLEKAIDVENYDERYAQLGRLVQTAYKITTDDFGGLSDFDRLMHITINFNLSGNGRFSFNIEGKSRIEQEIAFLSSRKVKFEWKYIQGLHGIPAASFTVTKNIPVRFRFEVDYAQSKIKLLINNHVHFDFYDKVFTPDAFDEQFLDQIAQFMLRLDNDLIQLEMSHEHKLLIQRMLQEDKRRNLLANEELKQPFPQDNAFQSDNILKHIRSFVTTSKEG